jgi:ubiquinone/menaquinone biosynthesis C-methylase UbiE
LSKDLFSGQSKQYAMYRPSYPHELFEYILSFVEQRETAWDCATGNGQSAILLSQYFRKVIASDISKKQLSEAPVKDNIEYVVSPAEETPFAENSFDLITVAQAYHWFNQQRFLEEATRVAKNNAIVAIWMYDLIRSEEDTVNRLTDFFYNEVVGAFWDKERKHIEDHYSQLPFLFESLPSKQFHIRTSFTKESLKGYFSTWSTVQHFISEKGYSPIKEIERKLDEVWQSGESKPFSFPIYLKMGKVKK